MISARDFWSSCPRELEMYTQGQINSQVLLWKGCDHRYPNLYIVEANNITIQWRRMPAHCARTWVCAVVYFSFHPVGKVPVTLNTGLYNCSVDYYWRFKLHLDCNLKVECEDGRDEAEHCPYSSPACQGWVAIGNKCYTYVSRDTLDRSVQTDENSHVKAVKFCASLNASIATFRTSNELHTISDIFRKRISMDRIFSKGVVGIFYGTLSVPNIYRRSLVGYDRTVIHHSLTARGEHNGDTCFVVKFHRSTRSDRLTPSNVHGMEVLSCSSDDYINLVSYAICELTSHDSDQNHNDTIAFFQASFTVTDPNFPFSRCPNGQMVQTFLACFPHSACDEAVPHVCTLPSDTNMASHLDTDQLLPSLRVFACNDGITRLSYTLVCDFRHHCNDGSDETFCQHPPCAAFACSNGQCVSYSKRCDLVSDCLDDSDEEKCVDSIHFTIQSKDTRSPVLINFDDKFLFNVEEMSLNETCPDTHYRCPGEYNDCLPVFTRCNGWYDCLDHEDEKHCETTACPGFYRCFNSTVCLHADNLCDGWPHCPQHDDEWLCDMTCPAQCLCQGHAFLCSKPFSPRLFPHLRYADARGSGMTLSDLSNHSYIVYLSLSNCSLSFVSVMTFPNLQILDLSVNNLTVVSMVTFTRLANLRTLSLAKNPIDLIQYDPHTTVQLSALKTIDLSHNRLTVFDSKTLSNALHVQILNLSFSTIHTIHSNGFQYTPKLTQLYLAGNRINMFSADIFESLGNLRILSSQTYKLCCRKILPDHFEIISCDAPQDEISSCEDLLQSGMYRAFLYLIGFLSLLGNVVCLVVRTCVQRTASRSGFHVFVTNLSSADLLMGVYLAIIAVADSLFRGNYLFKDEVWKHSVACKVAGFLSMLSCEVSALIIWLITLDRFIVLHFPFSRVRFQKRSAASACLITWLAGLLLAIVPLLPWTSHWEFFSQTGICIPLPVTRQDFKGKAFSFSIFIVFNFVLFVFIATGQAFVYWSIQRNALYTESTKVSRDLTIARRLISVAVTDFLCWFPIGICGLLALSNIPVPGEVNVAFAIFVLPLNSALNPFMYTFNMVMEKKRKSREARLLQWLESNQDLL